MAANVLADVFERVLWTTEDIRNSSEMTNFINSKILVSDATITAKVNAEDSGSLIYIPYVQEDLYSEASIMDDSGNLIPITKTDKKQAQAFVGFYAKAWGEKNIVREIGSGISAIDSAQALMGRYWNKDIQARMVSSLVGCIADNKASHASDNVLTDTVNTFSYTLAIDALSKVGESMDKFVAVAVHSGTYAHILKNNAAQITAVIDDLGIERKFYNGMELIVSDLLPVDAVAGTTTTVFLKAGAFVFADAMIDTPVVLYTDPRVGFGAGETSVISKYAYLLHVNGYTFTNASVVGVSPSVAELASAANWDRLVDAKQAPFVALESKS